ncbi:MAG: hypothetical protein Hens2KO_05350 [Henriciella sp.]
MRSVLVSILLTASLSGCATVSMVASEATVETQVSASESSLRKVSDAYTDLAERKLWIAKNTGLLGFARVLMDGASNSDESAEGTYLKLVTDEAASNTDQVSFVKSDIDSAAHGLDVATMEVQKLFGAGLSAKALRADLLSYESALVTAKKARRTFVTTLSELDIDEVNSASYALTELDLSIDKARDAADKLADYAADQKLEESLS